MRIVTNEELIERLTWRYATKRFDPERKIPDADWEAVSEGLRLSPSSSGLQPWHFYVITNPELRTKLRAVSSDQRQITEGSHLVVFGAKTDLTEGHIDSYIARMSEVRGTPIESFAGFRESALRLKAKKSDPKEMLCWTTRQCYIALGSFLNACAARGIDACPMEGFESEKYDELLNTAQHGVKSCVVAVAGYRSAEDKYATAKKVRFTREQVITELR